MFNKQLFVVILSCSMWNCSSSSKIGTQQKNLISDFKRVNGKGQGYEVDLTGGDNLFVNCTDEDLTDYYSWDSSGLSWKCDGTDVMLHEEHQYFQGLPTPNLDKVVVVFPVEHPVKAANAAIYYCNGRKFMDLTIPKLVSPLYRERSTRMRSDLRATTNFNGVFLTRDKDNKVIIAVGIDFDREYWETRVLNPETGEFGDCLGYGRR